MELNCSDEKKVSWEYQMARRQIEHRALWLGLIFDEMRKAGIDDTEKILRNAVRRCGSIHGERHRANCQDPENLNDFRALFFNDRGQTLFEMTDIKSDHDNAWSTFHYCALVEAWRGAGCFSDEDIALLCDIAMDGDRGVAEKMGVTLDISTKISEGCENCQLHFHK